MYVGEIGKLVKKTMSVSIIQMMVLNVENVQLWSTGISSALML